MSDRLCWAADDEGLFGACYGEEGCSEDYEGEYTYFCERHGHFEDYVRYGGPGIVGSWPWPKSTKVDCHE